MRPVDPDDERRGVVTIIENEGLVRVFCSCKERGVLGIQVKIYKFRYISLDTAEKLIKLVSQAQTLRFYDWLTT